ncbi:MAG: energy transducer TonB, partial [Myxococcaceae bacterium]
MTRVLLLLSTLLGAAALAQSVTPPEVVESPPAEYPPGATTSAVVVTQVTVDAAGQVTTAEIAESAGKEFDDAALAAVRRWTFRPALRDGKPFAARVRIPFRFEPPSGPASTGPDAGTPVAPLPAETPPVV